MTPEHLEFLSEKLGKDITVLAQWLDVLSAKRKEILQKGLTQTETNKEILNHWIKNTVGDKVRVFF